MTRQLLAWTDDELKRFIGWVEENQEAIRGSTLTWTARLKDTVFGEEDHIDQKRIKTKFHNMKNSWKAAKQMQNQSGFGLTEADCVSSVNGLNPAKISILSL